VRHADSGKDLRGLDDRITWTTWLRKDAALYGLPPARTGKRGRPRVKGSRLPALKILATRAAFTQVTVTRYGKTATVQAAVISCLWYSVLGPRTVRAVLIRDKSAAGYDLALVTTDTAASPEQVIERHAARRPAEVANEDARQIFGAGEARNRKVGAVRRTLPFTLACQTLAMLWYATAGHHDADIAARRQQEPWYTTKTQPSTSDMIAKRRRVLIAAKYRPARPASLHQQKSTPYGWPGKPQQHDHLRPRKSSGYELLDIVRSLPT
jgi:hypothetical protein